MKKKSNTLCFTKAEMKRVNNFLKKSGEYTNWRKKGKKTVVLPIE